MCTNRFSLPSLTTFARSALWTLNRLIRQSARELLPLPKYPRIHATRGQTTWTVLLTMSGRNHGQVAWPHLGWEGHHNNPLQEAPGGEGSWGKGGLGMVGSIRDGVPDRTCGSREASKTTKNFLLLCYTDLVLSMHSLVNPQNPEQLLQIPHPRLSSTQRRE